MTWRPVDCHAHSTFSDGALPVPDVIARANELGVQASVSDHISLDVVKSIKTVDGTRAYLDTLEQFDVLRGGEFCWHDTLWRELPENVVRRFTHRLGSLHAVRMPDGSLVRAFARTLPAGLTVEAYMDAHITSLESLAREMPVDILAHPTIVTIPYRELNPEELWSEESEERLVNALFESGIAFELSNRYWPHERLVRRAAARGVRFSLGSDGHTLEQIADIKRPLALARSLGIADEDLYDPRRHGSKASSGTAVLV